MTWRCLEKKLSLRLRGERKKNEERSYSDVSEDCEITGWGREILRDSRKEYSVSAYSSPESNDGAKRNVSPHFTISENQELEQATSCCYS
jgi:hypothetical protein